MGMEWHLAFCHMLQESILRPCNYRHHMITISLTVLIITNYYWTAFTHPVLHNKQEERLKQRNLLNQWLSWYL